jgi:hypothetical protein
MPLRNACHTTALLLAVHALCGSAAVVRSAVSFAAHSSTAVARAAPPDLVAAFSHQPVALVPSWTPETAVQSLRILRSIRHPGRPAASAVRSLDSAAVALPLFFRITPFVGPEDGGAAARTRADACSSFATTLPPPLAV